MFASPVVKSLGEYLMIICIQMFKVHKDLFKNCIYIRCD